MKQISRFLPVFLIVALLVPNIALSKAVSLKGNESITRGGAASVLVKYGALEINTNGGPHFPDVPTTHPFYSAIETLVNASIWSGYSDGTFRPDSSVNKAEAAKLIVLTHEKFVPHKVSNPFMRVLRINNTCGFPQDVTPDAWYYSYVRDLYNHGVDVTD